MLSTKKIKHLLLNWFEQKGVEVNKKEEVVFKGQKYFLTKSAFFRLNEKDDGWLFALGRHKKNILDIGCNIGQSSFLFLVGTNNRIICVDPNPKALSRCAENLIYNNFGPNATFINAFVSDKVGESIKFYSSLTDAAGSMFSTFAKTSSSIGKSKMVNQLTVDAICQSTNFVPDLIKVDVEGAEQLVLKGISSVLEKARPYILVEVHSGIGLTIVENTNKILEWCKAHAYQAYYLKMHSKLQSSDEVKHRGRYHTLLLPEGENYPEYLKQIPENFNLNQL